MQKILTTSINLGIKPHFTGEVSEDGIRVVEYLKDNIVDKFPLLSCETNMLATCELNLFMIHRYLGDFSVSRNAPREGDAIFTQGYLSRRKSDGLSLKGVKSLADSLLPFLAWLNEHEVDWQTLMAEPSTNTRSGYGTHPLWDYRNDIKAKVEKNQLGFETGRNRISAIRQFYEWCWKNRRINKLPFTHVKKVIRRESKNGTADLLFSMAHKEASGIPVWTTNLALPARSKQKKASPEEGLNPYSIAELSSLLSSPELDNTLYELAVKLGFQSGLRSFENLYLTKDMISNPLVDERPAYMVSIVGKNTKQRNIAVPKGLMASLYEWVSSMEYRKRQVRHETRYGMGKPVPVFINRSGQLIAEGSITNITTKVRNHQRENGLPVLERTYHDLRSTFATMLAAFLLERGFSEKFIQAKLMALMGHDSFSTTLRYINFAKGVNFGALTESWIADIYQRIEHAVDV